MEAGLDLSLTACRVLAQEFSLRAIEFCFDPRFPWPFSKRQGLLQGVLCCQNLSSIALCLSQHDKEVWQSAPRPTGAIRR